jgi:hypothetical protein
MFNVVPMQLCFIVEQLPKSVKNHEELLLELTHASGLGKPHHGWLSEGLTFPLESQYPKLLNS